MATERISIKKTVRVKGGSVKFTLPEDLETTVVLPVAAADGQRLTVDTALVELIGEPYEKVNSEGIPYMQIDARAQKGCLRYLELAKVEGTAPKLYNAWQPGDFKKRRMETEEA